MEEYMKDSKSQKEERTVRNIRLIVSNVKEMETKNLQTINQAKDLILSSLKSMDRIYHYDLISTMIDNFEKDESDISIQEIAKIALGVYRNEDVEFEELYLDVMSCCTQIHVM